MNKTNDNARAHQIRKETKDAGAILLGPAYRWTCTCKLKSAWFSSQERRDAAAGRHADKHS